jgi:hypothetical protein
MSNNNPFSTNQYDLGAHTDIGSDKAEIDNSLLYSAMDIPTQCYVCTSPSPKYQIVAKNPAYNTAQIQNGLYICNHCLGQNILDNSLYGVREIV